MLVFGNQYFLALGETLSFSEQYQHLATTKAELLYKGFISLPTLKLIHWMVENYYTTYKSVVRLFFTPDMEKLLERESKSTKARSAPDKNRQKLASLAIKIAPEGQTLIVFPDLRTMTNEEISADVKKLSDDSTIVTLLSSNTQNQKDVHRWEIKKGLKSVIICTYAEIFQDFHNVKKIIFVDPHKWYYAAQQDPRYKVGEVLSKMEELYGAEVEIV